MGFTSGAKTVYDILEEIVAGLIAGGGWSDADATWTTSNKTMANLGRRVLKYENGAEVIYWAFEIINQTSGQNWYYGNSAWHYGKGIRITASSSWDSVNHTYPVSNQQTFVPFEVVYNGGVGTDLATLQLTYYLWVEAKGFCLLAKPEPTGSNYQQSFFIVLERNPNKEYTDGQSNFYLMKWCNIWYCYYDAYWGPAVWRDRTILRPFAYQFPDYPSAWGNWGNYSPNGNGISFVANPSYWAFKSNGNGKVYYVKPIINNTANQLSPIFQVELWFPWSEGVGLVDGDVIAIEGSTTKYLCKALDSPDSTNRITVAMKYVA